MPISGLVITLEPDADPVSLGALLLARPGIAVGKVEGRWMALVAEAPDEVGSRTLHEWLERLPGVAFVDVVHVSFEDEAGSEQAGDIGPSRAGARSETDSSCGN
jgi:hypothetical protein